MNQLCHKLSEASPVVTKKLTTKHRDFEPSKRRL